MKVAVVGAGGWGKNLVAGFHALDALGLIAELNPEIRSKMAAQYPGVPVLNSLSTEDWLEFEAVAIATPAPTHYELAKQALERGKDVFVEKPMTLSVREAEELVVLAQSKRRILMVGHLLLYQPAIVWIREYLRSGQLGELWSLNQERLNLGRVRVVENVLWSFGVHDIAVLLDLVAAPMKSLVATGQCALQPSVEDDIHLHMNFENHVQAHLHCSWLWPERRRHLTVIGSKGMLVYDELAQTVVLHRKTIGSELQNVDQGTETVFKGAEEPLHLELRHFLECVQTRRRPQSDGESGLRVIRVLEQASKQLDTAIRRTS